jgi:CheY-like chemotaxis protein
VAHIVHPINSTPNQGIRMFAAKQGEGQGGAPPPRAFVVEDDVMMLRLLSEVVASVGLEPLTFTRLSTARRALHERVPAVLLVDDDLPDGRGADLVRELRADPRTRNVKAIVCTSAGPSRRRQISQLAPVIAKPFAVDQLESALREVAAAPPS